MICAFIGLGSNLQSPVQQIHTAMDALKILPYSHFLAASSLYRSKPVGLLEQPDFVNAVVKIETQLTPVKLLSYLHTIEKAQGRIRSKQRNAPRIIDLDLLLYGDIILNKKNLTIPHPRLTERAFVLVPLMEIAKELMLPNGEVVKELVHDNTLKDVSKININRG